MKGIDLLQNLQPILPQTSILTIYQSFIRPHFDYDDVVYDQNFILCFFLQTRNFSIQYSFRNYGSNKENVNCYFGLTWIGVTVGISSTKKMDETPFPTLQSFSTKLPSYIYDFIPPVRQFQRHPNTFNFFYCRTEYFKSSFFPWVIGDWNKLNPEICSFSSYDIFRKLLLTFIRPSASNVYNISYTIGIKSITRLHLGFSHLKEHKFKHKFQKIRFVPILCLTTFCLQFLSCLAGYT